MRLIAGIDPGTTTGIALLNFKGELVDLFSSKDMGIDEVIKRITKFGKISVVACDVSPVPQLINKLSAKTGAVVFKPYISLPVRDKKELTKNFTVKDAHQRDSLAAGLNAFNKFKNKFVKIDSEISGLSEEQKDEIKHRFICRHSIDSSIKDLMEKKEEKKQQEQEKRENAREKPTAETQGESQIKILQENKIKELETQNKTLRDEINDRENEILELNDKIIEIKGKYNLELHRDKKISEDDQIIKSFEYGMKDLQERLNEKINEVDKIVELWGSAAKQKVIPVGIFPESFSEVSWVRRKFKKKDYDKLKRIKILFISNPGEHTDLIEKRMLVCDDKYLKEIEGCV